MAILTEFAGYVPVTLKVVTFAAGILPVKLRVLSPLTKILKPLPLVKGSVLPFVNVVHPGSLDAPEPTSVKLPAFTSLYQNALGALRVD